MCKKPPILHLTIRPRATWYIYIRRNQPGEKSKDGNPFDAEAFHTGSRQIQRAAKIMWQEDS